MKYWFSVIRFVPSPVRGERVNVGVIVGSDEASEWQIQVATEANRKRCESIDDDSMFPSLQSTIYRWQRLFESYDAEYAKDSETLPISLEWLKRVSARHRNIVQLSAPSPVVATDIDEAVDTLFESYVRSSAEDALVIETKRHVVRELKRSFSDRGLVGTRFLEHRRVIRSAHHKQLVDFLLLNGDVLQLSQAWSFRRPNIDALIGELKAWTYTMKKLRDDGGFLGLGTDDVRRIPSTVSIEIVYLPPDNPKGEDAFEEASHMFEDVHAHVTPVANVDEVADNAIGLLADTGVNVAIL